MDVGSVLLTVFTLAVGFLLGEFAAARRQRADIETRWDKDRRRLYATYLTHADTYHRIFRDLRRIERRLDDPEGATAEIAPEEMSEEAFTKMVRTMVETARKAREELWGRRKEVGDRLRELEAELDILGTHRAQVSYVLLSLEAEEGEMAYQKARESFLLHVREELQVPDGDGRSRTRARIGRWWKDRVG